MIQSLRMKGFTGLCICIQTNSQFKDEKNYDDLLMILNSRMKGLSGICICTQTNSQFKDES